MWKAWLQRQQTQPQSDNGTYTQSTTVDAAKYVQGKAGEGASFVQSHADAMMEVATSELSSQIAKLQQTIAEMSQDVDFAETVVELQQIMANKQGRLAGMKAQGGTAVDPVDVSVARLVREGLVTTEVGELFDEPEETNDLAAVPAGTESKLAEGLEGNTEENDDEEVACLIRECTFVRSLPRKDDEMDQQQELELRLRRGRWLYHKELAEMSEWCEDRNMDLDIEIKTGKAQTEELKALIDHDARRDHGKCEFYFIGGSGDDDWQGGKGGQASHHRDDDEDLHGEHGWQERDAWQGGKGSHHSDEGKRPLQTFVKTLKGNTITDAGEPPPRPPGDALGASPKACRFYAQGHCKWRDRCTMSDFDIQHGRSRSAPPWKSRR